MRLEVRRVLALPFRKARLVDVKPSDLTLMEPMYEEPEIDTESAVEKFRREEEKRRLERTRLLSAPFRHMGAFIRGVGRNLLKVWTRSGFVKMQIQGKKGRYKLDRDGGWTLDEGRTLDRLLRVKPA